jgi:hypothetical protein
LLFSRKHLVTTNCSPPSSDRYWPTLAVLEALLSCDGTRKQVIRKDIYKTILVTISKNTVFETAYKIMISLNLHPPNFYQVN